MKTQLPSRVVAWYYSDEEGQLFLERLRGWEVFKDGQMSDS